MVAISPRCLNGAIMTDNMKDDARQRAERRAFLEKCGRFSVVTPPVVTLMLAVSGGTEALATSAKTITPTTTLTTTTTPTTTTKTTIEKTTIEKTTTIQTTTIQGSTVTKTLTTGGTTATITVTDTVSKVPVPTTTTQTDGTLLLLQTEPSDPSTRLAMIIDSMGLMKIT
jgi:hypothetical protein